MRTHLPPAVQAPAGHAQPEALRAADLVQLFGRLGLAMFLAGLDAVHGSWPLLHCAADQWAALINFCAWRVLPSRRLAPYRSEEHRAWELLPTRERDCLLPKRRGRNMTPAADAARQPQQQQQQQQPGSAFWLTAANCFCSDTGRWALRFRLNETHLQRAARAKLHFAAGMEDALWDAHVAAAANFSVNLHRLVCWWKGGCAVPGADVLRDRLYACHSCVHAPSCINPAHLSWNTPAANRRQAVDAHAACKRRRQASARKAGRVRASKRRTPDPAYRPGRR